MYSSTQRVYRSTCRRTRCPTDPFGARGRLGPGLPDFYRLAAVADRIDLDGPGHAQDPARERAPPRRRRRRHARRRRDPGRVAAGRRGRGRDPVHAGPGHPPGLHRRPGRRRPGRHARRDGRPRRRSRAGSIRSSRPTSSSTTPSRSTAFGTPAAFAFNVEREYERNGERYQLLRWAQTAFRDLRVVPPGTGIVHQVNLEFLATVVADRDDEAAGSPSRTRSSGPTRTRRWSTAWASSATASVGSRPRPCCSASRSTSRCRGSSASGSTASCPAARPRPTSSSS